VVEKRDERDEAAAGDGQAMAERTPGLPESFGVGGCIGHVFLGL
jgi:hypothetical protein